MKGVVFYVIVLVLTSAPVFAENTASGADGCPPVTSWQHVVRAALSSNLNYTALLHDARAEYFRIRAKTDWQNPQVLLHASLPEPAMFSHSEESRLYGSRLRFYVPNPFLNDHLRLVARASRRSLEAQARVERSEAALAVYQLCSELQMAQALQEIHQERGQLLEQREAFLKERLEKRLAPQAEMQALQIQKMQQALTVEQVRQSIETARRTLAVLTRLPADAIRLPALSREVAVQASGEAERKRGVASAPAYQVAAETVLKTEAARRAARADRIPWFDYVDAGYTFRDSSDEGQWQLRVAFILPLFSSSMDKSAKASYDAAQLRQAEVERQLSSRFSMLQQELRDAWGAVGRLPAVPVPVKDEMMDLELYFKMCEACLSLKEQQLDFLYRPLVVCGEIFQILNAWETFKE